VAHSAIIGQPPELLGRRRLLGKAASGHGSEAIELCGLAVLVAGTLGEQLKQRAANLQPTKA
jgi:hypothetical protein